MSREDELREAMKDATPKRRQRRGTVVGRGRFRTRINWGFWVMIGAFVVFLVTWFILRPLMIG